MASTTSTVTAPPPVVSPPPVTTTQNTACTVDPSATTTTSGTDSPVVTPAATTISLYPGQTAQLSVAIGESGSGAAAEPVVVGANSIPLGLTVTQASTETGNSAQLTLTAALGLASNCFNGTDDGLDSVTVPMEITANTATGETTVPVAVQVVLENPAYQPATMTLPLLSITTAGSAPIADTSNYVTGSFSIADASDPSMNYTGTGEIKGHGNTTWLMPKKPYKIKLDSKAGLLGMKKAKDWILLANYDDKSMLRTALAFDVSNLFGMFWTPSAQFVEVLLNGAYEGTYQLSEDVEIDSNRLDIAEVSADSGDGLTGGYLLEIDNWYNEDFMTETPKGLPIGSQDPNPPDTAQEQYLTQTLDTAENALYSETYTDPSTGWQAYFDESSLVNWYLVEELMGNQDADFWSSDFFYKIEDDPHFYMGPVWDFDISSGNVNYSADTSPTTLWVRQNALWYEQLFTDPTFLAAVKARWTEVRPQLAGLSSFLDTQAAALATAQANNFARWPILNETVWPNSEVAGSYQGEVDFLKSWLAQRLAYMDSQYLNP